MAISQPPSPPQTDISSLAGRLWTLIDERVNTAVSQALASVGVPRPRPLTIVVPLADSSGAPNTGWLQSIPIYASSRILGWEIQSLTLGQVVLDLQLSTIAPSPSTAPTFTPMNGPDAMPSLNGYSTASRDTSNWLVRDFSSGSIINIYVISATAISSAVFALQLMDLDSRVLQT